MSDLPPHLYRLYRQNLRRNTTVKEYRQMHKLERALIIWPLHVYMWVKRRRTQPPPIEPPTGGFFNARKQSGGLVAVDITNHLIPWAIAKRMQADAWDEGYEAGSNDSYAWEAVNEGYVDFDEYEDTPNPYRENK